MNIIVLIPARLASTRLPSKPLADICGAPMIVRVAQRVRSGNALLPAGSPPQRIVVAADDLAIMDACRAHGVDAVMTRNDHTSGSDRLAEACDLLQIVDDDIVVNVQGDEPLIDPGLVGAVAQLLSRTPCASMSTAAHAIDSLTDFVNPNVVKVVIDAQHLALYFSRAPIPWWRDGFASEFKELPDPKPLRHIGIYAYRAGFLRQFPRLPLAPLETLESLEQLRALWHGHRIAVHITPHAPAPGVDTAQDLQRVRLLYRP